MGAYRHVGVLALLLLIEIYRQFSAIDVVKTKGVSPQVVLAVATKETTHVRINGSLAAQPLNAPTPEPAALDQTEKHEEAHDNSSEAAELEDPTKQGKARKKRQRRKQPAAKVGLKKQSIQPMPERFLMVEGFKYQPVRSPKPILPNLLLIGAQKAGSSALAQWFSEEGVCIGTRLRGEPVFYNKEMAFFDKPKRYAKGKEFYMERYQHCFAQNSTFVMDATPATIKVPDKVYETYQTDPNLLRDLKIILSIREPISRELSLYNHQLARYNNTPDPNAWYATVTHTNGTIKTFDQFVQSVTIPHLHQTNASSSVAHYARYLRHWFELFDPKQILVLSYQEDILAGNGAKKRIRDFLGYPFPTRGTFPPANTKKNSPFKVKTISCAVRDQLQGIFEPFHEELYKLLEDTPRPSMEQQPFPHFLMPDCVRGGSIAS